MGGQHVQEIAQTALIQLQRKVDRPLVGVGFIVDRLGADLILSVSHQCILNIAKALKYRLPVGILVTFGLCFTFTMSDLPRQPGRSFLRGQNAD